jgi:hypothetical protein
MPIPSRFVVGSTHKDHDLYSKVREWEQERDAFLTAVEKSKFLNE